VIQKLLGIAMLPLLLASSHLQLTEEDIQNNRDYFEVIDAATGKKEERTLYADKPVIQTHIMAVSAIRKALADEGIDPSNVKVLLYYQGLTIGDDLAPRMWQNKPHPDTISSPWLDLTKTVNTAGETRITIRIDATASRFLSDLFPESANKSNISGFLEIPAIKESCYSKLINTYQSVVLESIYSQRIPMNGQRRPERKNIKSVEGEARGEVRKDYSCAPEKLREPLLSLMGISGIYSVIPNIPLLYSNSFETLNDECQNESEQYYGELYPQLAVRGLQILESELTNNSQWWIKVIDQIQPIQIDPITECR
jgi:hypothetical protein